MFYTKSAYLSRVIFIKQDLVIKVYFFNEYFKHFWIITKHHINCNWGIYSVTTINCTNKQDMRYSIMFIARWLGIINYWHLRKTTNTEKGVVCWGSDQPLVMSDGMTSWNQYTDCHNNKNDVKQYILITVWCPSKKKMQIGKNPKVSRCKMSRESTFKKLKLSK